MQEIEVKMLETGEVVRTNPGRDIALYGPQLLRDLLSRLTESQLSEHDRERLNAAGVSHEELCKAVAAFVNFMHKAIRTPEPMHEAAVSSGFATSPTVARDVVLEKFGMTCAGAMWDGLKSSVLRGDEPDMLKRLREAGEKYVSFEDSCRDGWFKQPKKDE